MVYKREKSQSNTQTAQQVKALLQKQLADGDNALQIKSSKLNSTVVQNSDGLREGEEEEMRS